MSSCPDCGLNVDADINPYIDHCHGTLVMHRDRSLECTDAACELPELLRHKFVIDCMAVLGGCCVTDEAADLPVAS